MGTPGLDPYVQEHARLVNSIRGDIPYTNDGMTVAESTMTCIMAREAAYSGCGNHLGDDHGLKAGPAAQDPGL